MSGLIGDKGTFPPPFPKELKAEEADCGGLGCICSVWGDAGLSSCFLLFSLRCRRGEVDELAEEDDVGERLLTILSK